MFVTILAFFAIILWYIHLIKVYNYWKKNSVAGPKPSFPFGNVGELAKRNMSLGQLARKYYFEYPEERFIGIYQGRIPTLIVKHPTDIKNVLIKDFNYFRNRNLDINPSPEGENLFNANDDTWRLLRHKMTSIFSTGKVRNMFPLMQECIEQFHTYLDHLAENDPVREMRQLMTVFTLQLFSSCILGLNVNTLNDDHNIFKYVATELFKPRMKNSVSRSIDSVFPGLIRILNVKQNNEEVIGFFRSLVKSMLKEREGKPKTRKDFIDLLIDLKEQGHITGNSFEGHKETDIEINEELITAQIIMFYAAGFETTAGTLSFLLHELALHQEMQEKAFKEIRTVSERHGGKLSYDGIQEMKYLELLLTETLRKYPIGGVLIREAGSDYSFPESKLTIHKGTKILIPVGAIHKDPKYYPQPDDFIPERFSADLKSEMEQCVYLPFGDGPRNCIAARFARTQSMMGVAGFLQKFRIVPSERTKETLTFNPISITLRSAGGIWLKILKRQDI